MKFLKIFYVFMRKNSSQKNEEFEEFMRDLRAHTKSERILVNRKGSTVDVGLVNIYRDEEFMNWFADIWVDWEGRLDSKIMVVGQDWGPYCGMKKVSDKFRQYVESRPDVDFRSLRDEFLSNPSDRTTIFLFEALRSTAQAAGIGGIENLVKKIFVTIAVFFARNGNKFRGNENFAPGVSADLSRPFLKRQIEIVQPRVIFALGNLATDSVMRIFNSKLEGSLNEAVGKDYPFELNGQPVILVPAYHPASFVSPKEQIAPYRQIWKIINKL